MLATAKDGSSSWKAVAEAFGATNALAGDSEITMNLRFPGQYFDEETQSHYNFYRDYSSDLGLYIQADPIGLRGGVNFYGYVGAKPLKLADWLGLFTVDKDCCDKIPDLEQDVKNACATVNLNIKEIGLKSCLQQRCEKAHISCDGIWCWYLNDEKQDSFGWNFGSSTANLCAKKHAGNGLLGWGCAVIHEWAHSCGWDHGYGKGIPDASLGLDKFLEECRKNWNPTNKGPSRGGAS